MKIAIFSEAFEPWRELEKYQQNRSDLQGHFGATAVFVGTMRDFNEGDDVQQMLLEHYPGMTERYLEGICQQAKDEYQLLDALILHRVGRIEPNDPIVLVAVWSAHRQQAFVACREIMEELKSKAPFWKKETLLNGQQRWVEKNTEG